jgi:hypothetical protein
MEYVRAAQSPHWVAFKSNWALELYKNKVDVFVQGIYPSMRFLYRSRPPRLSHDACVFVRPKDLASVRCGHLNMTLAEVISTLMKFAITGSEDCIMSPNLKEDTIKEAFEKLARSAAFYKVTVDQVTMPEDFELATTSFTLQPGKGLYLLVRKTTPKGRYQIVISDYTERKTATPILLREIREQSLVNRRSQSQDATTTTSDGSTSKKCMLCECECDSENKNENKLCAFCQQLWDIRAGIHNQLPCSIEITSTNS